MKILVYGTGGIGGYFGGRLAQTEHEVTFVARGNHLKAIQQNGLKVSSINGDFSISNANAVDDISNIEKQDLILICVKAWQVGEVASLLEPVIHEETAIIPLQNGISAPDYLKEHISEKAHTWRSMPNIQSYFSTRNDRTLRF